MKHKVTLQAAGYVGLPEQWLRKHDIRFGDKIDVVENEDGSLTLVPDDVILSQMLLEIGSVLGDKGVSLDQLFDYGDPSDDDADDQATYRPR